MKYISRSRRFLMRLTSERSHTQRKCELNRKESSSTYTRILGNRFHPRCLGKHRRHRCNLGRTRENLREGLDITWLWRIANTHGEGL